MTRRPPWFGPKEQMVLWVHGKLDELLKERHPKSRNEASIRRYADWVEGYGPEIEAAEHGDIEPLRKRLPRLARFLVAPPARKRKRQQKIDALTVAVWAAKRIPEIWLKEYGRKNRSKDQVGAIEIAALWMNVPIAAIERRMKPSGPSGKKKSRAD
jgi:hypothetical protein